MHIMKRKNHFFFFKVLPLCSLCLMWQSMVKIVLRCSRRKLEPRSEGPEIGDDINRKRFDAVVVRCCQCPGIAINHCHHGRSVADHGGLGGRRVGVGDDVVVYTLEQMCGDGRRPVVDVVFSNTRLERGLARRQVVRDKRGVKQYARRDIRPPERGCDLASAVASSEMGSNDRRVRGGEVIRELARLL